jgi:hypothetical protein
MFQRRIKVFKVQQSQETPFWALVQDLSYTEYQAMVRSLVTTQTIQAAT